MNSKNEINNVNIMLSKLFHDSVSNEKIKKVIMNKLGGYYNENYKNNFLKKYFLNFFNLGKAFKISHIVDANFNISNIATLLSLSLSFLGYIITKELFFLGPSFVFLLMLIGLFFAFKSTIKKENKYVEDVIEKYNKENLKDMFENNKLIFKEELLSKEKINKKQLIDTICFIKKYLSNDEIVEHLRLKKQKDITDIKSLHYLLLKVKNDLLNGKTNYYLKENLYKTEERENIINILEKLTPKNNIVFLNKK